MNLAVEFGAGRCGGSPWPAKPPTQNHLLHAGQSERLGRPARTHHHGAKQTQSTGVEM